MKIRQIILTAVTVMLFSTSNVWAARGGNPGPNPNAPGQLKKPPGQSNKVPEIDAASGTSAIALLMGALLLAGERSRSRRS